MAIADVLVGVAEVWWDGGSPAGTDLGFTSDGASMSINTETADIRVDQLHGPIRRVVLTQDVRVTLNMAEATLANLEIALPGSSLAATTLTLGGSAYQEEDLTLIGTSPAGTPRTIVLSRVNPVGEVGMPYKKGEMTIVPITFAALVNDDDEFGTIDD